MPGLLRIGLTGSPPRALLSRDADLPNELWYALGRNIAPDGTRQVDDRHVSVPIERLLSTRGWLASALDTYGCAVEPSPHVADLLDRHEAESDEIDGALDAGVEPANLVGVLDESRFRRRELREFQERDLAHLLALSHGANFSVPGAGKTTVAYALYEAERQRRGIERLLVVAPLSAFDAWLTEAEECLDPVPAICVLNERPPANCEVLLVNYQRLSGARFSRIAQWVAGAPCQLILDEAHRMKRGRNGEWGAACLDLAHLAVRRDLLTGTPAPQHQLPMARPGAEDPAGGHSADPANAGRDARRLAALATVLRTHPQARTRSARPRPACRAVRDEAAAGRDLHRVAHAHGPGGAFRRP
jgi:hypothetical protein